MSGDDLKRTKDELAKRLKRELDDVANAVRENPLEEHDAWVRNSPVAARYGGALFKLVDQRDEYAEELAREGLELPLHWQEYFVALSGGHRWVAEEHWEYRRQFDKYEKLAGKRNFRYRHFLATLLERVAYSAECLQILASSETLQEVEQKIEARVIDEEYPRTTFQQIQRLDVPGKRPAPEVRATFSRTAYRIWQKELALAPAALEVTRASDGSIAEVRECAAVSFSAALSPFGFHTGSESPSSKQISWVRQLETGDYLKVVVNLGLEGRACGGHFASSDFLDDAHGQNAAAGEVKPHFMIASELGLSDKGEASGHCLPVDLALLAPLECRGFPVNYFSWWNTRELHGILGIQARLLSLLVPRVLGAIERTPALSSSG